MFKATAIRRVKIFVKNGVYTTLLLYNTICNFVIGLLQTKIFQGISKMSLYMIGILLKYHTLHPTCLQLL